jgi:hypothetical protein
MVARHNRAQQCARGVSFYHGHLPNRTRARRYNTACGQVKKKWGGIYLRHWREAEDELSTAAVHAYRNRTHIRFLLQPSPPFSVAIARAYDGKDISALLRKSTWKETTTPHDYYFYYSTCKCTSLSSFLES